MPIGAPRQATGSGSKRHKSLACWLVNWRHGLEKILLAFFRSLLRKRIKAHLAASSIVLDEAGGVGGTHGTHPRWYFARRARSSPSHGALSLMPGAIVGSPSAQRLGQSAGPRGQQAAGAVPQRHGPGAPWRTSCAALRHSQCAAAHWPQYLARRGIAIEIERRCGDGVWLCRFNAAQPPEWVVDIDLYCKCCSFARFGFYRPFLFFKLRVSVSCGKALNAIGR